MGNAELEIKIVSAKYIDGITIAEEVIKTLIALEGKINEYYIYKVINTSAGENYNVDGYTQILNFSIKAAWQ